MSNVSVRHEVKRFRKEFSITEVTLNTLEEAFEKQGFTIIEYNSVTNDPDVETVIKALQLSEIISHSNGFIYVDNAYRLIFLNEKLSDSEKLLVLAHEEGHYYCGHTTGLSVVGNSVIEEYQANEFAHYLLQGGPYVRIRAFLSRHRNPIIISVIAVVISVSGVVASKEYHDRMIYEGDYYVTAHGEKYHLKNCVTIEGHETRRLTKEDVESGNYKPCSVCQPDK